MSIFLLQSQPHAAGAYAVGGVILEGSPAFRGDGYIDLLHAFSPLKCHMGYPFDKRTFFPCDKSYTMKDKHVPKHQLFD